MHIELDSPRFVFERAGIHFRGMQPMFRGPAEFCFDAPDGSTLLMPAPVTSETLRLKLAEHDEIVRGMKR